MSKKFGYVAAAALGAVALLGATALPASAADTGDTAVTFSLAGGTLDITVQANVALTAGVSGATSVAGQLGDVVVSDTRGVLTGWTMSAASSTFVGDTGTVSTGVSYDSNTASAVTGVTATSSGATSVTAGAPVATGTAATGNNTATFDPTLTVTLPTTSLTGNYAGTVTTSVA